MIEVLITNNNICLLQEDCTAAGSGSHNAADAGPRASALQPRTTCARSLSSNHKNIPNTNTHIHILKRHQHAATPLIAHTKLTLHCSLQQATCQACDIAHAPLPPTATMRQGNTNSTAQRALAAAACRRGKLLPQQQRPTGASLDTFAAAACVALASAPRPVFLVAADAH